MTTTVPLFVVLTMGIVQKGSTFLIAQRSNADDQSPGIWSFPGGKLENMVGECVVEENLKKELKEEVGVEIDEKVKLLANDVFIRSSGHYVLTLLFLCKWRSGKGEAREDQVDVQWATIEDLETMDLPSYSKKRVKVLKKYFQSIRASS